MGSRDDGSERDALWVSCEAEFDSSVELLMK